MSSSKKINVKKEWNKILPSSEYVFLNKNKEEVINGFVNYKLLGLLDMSVNISLFFEFFGQKDVDYLKQKIQSLDNQQYTNTFSDVLFKSRLQYDYYTNIMILCSNLTIFLISFLKYEMERTAGKDINVQNKKSDKAFKELKKMSEVAPILGGIINDDEKATKQAVKIVQVFYVELRTRVDRYIEKMDNMSS